MAAAASGGARKVSVGTKSETTAENSRENSGAKIYLKQGKIVEKIVEQK